MITNKQKETTQWVMDFALKNGCQAVRASIITATNNSFEYRNTQLDKLHQSSENKLYIELFVDGRYGSFSTNRIDKDNLNLFIEDGIKSTRYLAEDRCYTLPESERYYKQAVNDDDLDLYDSSIHLVDVADKIDLARQAVEEVYQSDDRIVSVSSNFGDGADAEYMITSNGLEVGVMGSAFSLTCEVSLKTDGDARAESYWYDSSIYWNDLIKKGIGKKALERALQKMGQRKIKSGAYDMLLDNTVSSQLLSPLISAMSGGALQQKSSFLLDRLGDKIVSAGLTVKDTPHLRKSFGARWYDGEGVKTYGQTIIDKGVLNTYFINTYNALKMGVEPTISSPSIITMEHGEYNFDSMLASLQKGIWVTGFNGGNTNPTTGDYSFGVEGFLVENGVAVTPISEMNITGNILDLWNNLLEVGNDPRLSSRWRIPSLLFSDINFSGL